MRERGTSSRIHIVAFLAIAAVAAACYATSPTGGDFVWSDAPRHALNGAFLFDMLREFPVRDPVRWAYDYYLQYPALSILFYPPLFYVLLVPVYALFGVSQASALLLSAGFMFMLGLSSFALARRLMPPLAALGVGIAAMASPEMAFWGRMVMLDIPSLALATWAVVHFLRFGDNGRTADLAAFLLLFLCALYTRQTVAFLAPALGVYLLWKRGWRFLVEPRSWLAGVLVGIALAPLVYINLRFASFNFEQAGAGTLRHGDALGEALFYLAAMPSQMGWPLFIAGLLGLALFALGRLDRSDRAQHLLLLAWIVLCYAMFTPIALKSPRYTLPLVVPWAIFAGLAVTALLRRRGSVLVMAGALCIVAWTLAFRPVFSFKGMHEAAMAAAKAAPPDSNIFFSGKYDGAFIFASRADSGRRDLSVIRADKVLVQVRVERAHGITEAQMTDAEMLQKIRDLGLKTIVHHVGFWTDVPIIARFEKLLRTPAFTEIGRIPIAANFPTSDATQLVVYRPNFPVADGRPKLPMALGHTGDVIK
ncbi:MAG: glycosyltransferase family 39 protein [Alphaproteobacteria bacterium]|nr:glycosyltransferase family 39 protein [Alphaproteobacteria bacterium]